MMKITGVSFLSERYLVRRIELSDVADVYELCRNNTLYYQYCPPVVSEQSIIDDLNALPPNKEMTDKYYLGYFDKEKLVAVMDLIMGYPDDSTAFIGFFMTDVSVQNAGVGSGIIDELSRYLRHLNVKRVRLGWPEGDPQSERFWHKNGFAETGNSYDRGSYTIIEAQKQL